MPAFELLMEMQVAFSGTFPPIPIPDEVISRLKAELNDLDPMFVTLPIGRIDAQSRNGRTYGRPAIEAMVQTINSDKPGGNLGHLPEADRATSFDIPPLMWLGATLQADGTAWGKAYVMPHATNVREYIRTSKITHALIGTSLYGMGELDDDGRVMSLKIEGIDLVHPQRVGVPMAAAVPFISAESFSEPRAAAETTPPTNTPEPKEPIVATEVTTPPAQGLTPALPVTPAAPVSETEQQRKHTEAVRVLNETITKQGHDLEDYKQIVSELGNPADPLVAFRLLQEKLRQAEEENGRLLQETMESQVKALVKVPTVQPIVLTMLKSKKPTTRAKVEQMLKEIVDSPELKDLLTTQVVAESGPAHQRPATPATDKPAESVFLGY